MEPRFAARVSGITSSAIREIFKHLGRPGLISFAGGNPGSFALPDEQAADIAQRLLRHHGKTLLQYGQTEGWLPLREALIPYIRETFNTEASLDTLLITTGSMQGLDLLCRTLLDAGDVVLCESPVFLGALQALKSFQAQVIPVACDEQGMLMDDLERLMQAHRPKLLYTIPTFQNPTGKTLPEERRKKVAELAAMYQVVVAEDDPYLQLRYEGRPMPSIASSDKEGWVALLGSFSKVISPGLRVGFLSASPALVRKCVQFKQCTDVHTANLNQAIVDVFLRDNLLTPHLKRVIPQYRDSLNAMLTGLAAIPQIRFYTKPEGGLFVFAELAEHINAQALFSTCLEQGLAFVPGTPFYPQDGHHNTLRLNFSSNTPETIQKGTEILARCLSQH